MKKIIIYIQERALLFTYKHRETIREDLMNTNIISDSEIVFSDDYLQTNQKIVIPFFQELCELNNIDTLVFQSNSLAIFLLPFFENIQIENIKVKRQEITRYELCELLVKLKSINTFDCYSIPNFMLEFLDKHHILVTTHSEVFYVSSFMQQNKINDYSKMYYQKKIKIYEKLHEEDKEDFIAFLKINRYLKVITFYELAKEDLEFVLNALQEHKFKHVYLELQVNISTHEEYNYLKQLNKKYKKEKYVIGLLYSDDYLKDNIMKQILINTLRLCGMLVVILIVGMICYVSIKNYQSLKEVSYIQENVKEQMKNPDVKLPPEIEEHVIKNKYIAALIAINPDVIGYLKVNNTNIDYPVVIAEDNKYYLNRNLYQEEDENGWIFMDFRNSDKHLNDNTIIYGHNMYYSGVMFGTLHKALNASWYKNPDNLQIQFDTMYENMKWQIYSIYTIAKTTDYLKVSFETAEEKLAYIDMTRNRSIHNFEIDVTENDKILTLSTCTGDNSRLVIHAKLI